MKAKLLFSLFLVFLGNVFISCNSEDTIQPNSREYGLIKKKTIKNIVTFPVDNLSLESMQEYDFSSQQEVFKKMTSDQRYQLWKKRLSEVKMRLSHEELEHLGEIEALLNVNFFQTTMTEETSKFFFDWMAQAKRTLQWSELETITLFCTFEPVFLTSERGSRGDPNQPEPDDNGENCICSWDSYCDVFTQGVHPDCADYGCSETNPGCGWLLLQACSGRCHAER